MLFTFSDPAGWTADSPSAAPVTPSVRAGRASGWQAAGPGAASADSTHPRPRPGRSAAGGHRPPARGFSAKASPAPAEPALLASEQRPRRSVCCCPASRVPPRPPGRMRCGPRCGRGHAAPLKTLRLLRPAHRPPLTSELILPFGLGLWNVPWCRPAIAPPPPPA